MRKIYVLLASCLLMGTTLMAQKDTLRAMPPLSPRLTKPASPFIKPKNLHYISFSLHAPVDVFARSHIAGAGINYLWVNPRFGIYIGKKKMYRKFIGLTANGGVDYFLGKNTEVAGHDFKYGGYTYLYAQAGIGAGLFKGGSITLTGGPSMGIYKGNSDFGWSASSFVNYGIKKSRIAIGAGATYRKHKEADALWTAVIRAIYRL